MKNLSGFLAGLLFGMGLVVAGMTDPEKVLAFLTVGAHWNPSLIYVLGSAVVTASIGFAWVNRRMAPLFDESFHSPSSFVVDKRLLAGSVLFGLGWGTAGYCPGPALVGVMTLDHRAALFLIAFIVGVLIYERWFSPTSDLLSRA